MSSQTSQVGSRFLQGPAVGKKLSGGCPRTGRFRSVRIFHVLAVCCAAALALGQEPDKPAPFATIKPDVTIVLKKHAMGGDILEVTALDSKYPPELLRKQLLAIGASLNSQVNGLKVWQEQIDPENKELVFLKASCGMFGLWDSESNMLRLQELVRGFAGAPEPYTVEGISLMVEGFKPNDTTIRYMNPASILLEGVESSQPQGMEYRIGLKTQDPDLIVIPFGKPEPSSPKKPSQSQEGLPGFVWAAIGAAGLAAGVLVYLSLLRDRRSSA